MNADMGGQILWFASSWSSRPQLESDHDGPLTGTGVWRNKHRSARVDIGGECEIVAFGAFGLGPLGAGTPRPLATVVGETT